MRLASGLQDPVEGDHRGIGLLATPVTSLGENVSTLHAALGKDAEEEESGKTCASQYCEFGQSVLALVVPKFVLARYALPSSANQLVRP